MHLHATSTGGVLVCVKITALKTLVVGSTLGTSRVLSVCFFAPAWVQGTSFPLSQVLLLCTGSCCISCCPGGAVLVCY
ncbi:hypothetical protein BX600DRAFT_48928 [Xylariales sp. PMI_506]|nr:hypothetical protein BX600DRAFT_48928 [Xylariales sp. PMI_506]